MWWLFIIIFVVLGGLFIAFTGYGDFEEFLGGAFMGFVFSLIFLVISFCLSFADVPNYESAPIPMAALQDGSSIEGSFFLGCGSINEKMTYTFLMGNEEEGFKMEQVDASSVTIKFTEDAPHYTKMRSKLNWYGRFLWGVDSIGASEYVFYVPEGTIKYNYNIDLQ